MMTVSRLDIVFLGLSITSSWGNGHATTYRGLMKALIQRGHRVLFLERDVPWYASNRDLPEPPYGRTELYASPEDLKDRFAHTVQHADLVVVGSYVPQGIAVGEWVIETADGLTAFYDIDTPVTLQCLARGDCEYLSPPLIPRYDLYLSFTGGPTLKQIETQYGSPLARALYCSVDPDLYHPEAEEILYDLGYMGTYSDDRQPVLERLLLEPARRWKAGRFAVAGPQYPGSVSWPDNTTRIEHLPPSLHRTFYNRQRFTLNVTRADMVRAGWSPSVRLFEAAACGTPILSDEWPGIEEFFRPGTEILISCSAEETLNFLQNTSEPERLQLGMRACERVRREHTAAHRVETLERYVEEARERRRKTWISSGRIHLNTLETWIADPRSPIERQIAEMGPWFHNLRIDGAQTAPDHPLGDFPAYKWQQIEPFVPADLSGWRALDIGCNAGYYTFELARRGAHVTAVDVDDRYLQQARWAARQYRLEDRIRFRRMQIYDLAGLKESFDLVLFLGVFYHLRYPLLALDIVAAKVRKMMLFQTLTMPGEEVYPAPPDMEIHERDQMLDPGWPKMAFIENRLAGDPTNWWAPSHAAVEALLRSGGMNVERRIGHEMYYCTPTLSQESNYNPEELRSALRGLQTYRRARTDGTEEGQAATPRGSGSA